MAAALLAERAASQRRQTAEQLLEDYAAFAAWSYSAQLREALLESGWMVLNPVMHENLHEGVHIPDATSLTKYYRESIERCRCDPAIRPATYFGFTLGSDTLGTVGSSLDPATRRAVVAQLAGALRQRDSEPPLRIAITLLHLPAATLTSYGLMPTARGDTVVYGFIFEAQSLARLAQEAGASPKLLPQAVTRGRAVGEIVAIEVTSPAGEVLHRDTGWPSWRVVREERLPVQAAGLVLRASVRPEAASFLVAGGLPGSRVPYLLFVGVLAVALAVIAIAQLRRENQLARIRSDFVAAVSHELRTPLAQIRLFLETVRLRRFTSEEQREWLMSHVNREATRLSHLVDNLLHFTQLDRGAVQRVNPEAVELAEETAGLLDAFVPLAASRKVTFARQFDEGAVAMVDRARYRQVVLNLLDNAVKFGPVGQTITVAIERRETAVQLRVNDQGRGVPAGERSHIWDAFYRGQTDATRSVGGSGIGLAVVQDAVLRSNGRVWVEEAPGGGASFVVELPAGAPARAEALV